MNNDIISRNALKEEFAKHEDRKGYLIGDWEEIIDNAPPIETTIDTLISTLSVETLKTITRFKVDTPSGEAFVYKREETGQWIEMKTNPPEFLGHRIYSCSKCGREIDVMTPDESLDDYPYCHCGACMIKEARNYDYKLDNCPFCGGKAIFDITSEFTKHSEIGFAFKIKCTRCNITFPEDGKVSLTLEENGTLRYTEDNRLDLASAWNSRIIEETEK